MFLHDIPFKDRTKEFADLLMKHCSRLNERGLNVVPYTNESLAQFESLPAEKQLEIMNRYREFYLHFVGADIYQFPDRETPIEDKHCIHSFLRRTGYELPDGEDLSFIEPNWVIEVYDKNLMQIFRNHEFHRQCMYDLCTLESYSWLELYEREDPGIIMGIYQFGQEMLNEHRQTMPWELKKHKIKETKLKNNRMFTNHHKYITPLFQDGEHVAAINFVESQLIKTVDNVIELTWN